MSEPTSAELEDRRDAAHPGAGHQGHNTTPMAWVLVVVIIAATAVGGVALCLWIIPMFWAAVGVFVVAVIWAGAIGIMDQVTEYDAGGRGGDPQATVPGG